MSKDTGGPAFPQVGEESHFGQGMTLRDYFAAKAMQECLRVAADHSDDGTLLSILVDKAAQYAYRYADAMLAERNKS